MLTFVMNNHSRILHALSCLALALCLCAGAPAEAAYKIGSEESYLKIGGILQAWATADEKGAPDSELMENEFYIRRMRIMLYGQVNQWVNFFVETDSPNLGKEGNQSVDTFIQDAYLEFNLHPMIQVDLGMILIPFSHHGMQGATSLMALDYHGSLVRYPAGSTKVWRDYGVMLRGLIFENRLEYRVGLFNGVHGDAATVRKAARDVDDNGVVDDIWWKESSDPRNASDYPRLTARLTCNLFDPEGGAGVGGMFYDGLYLKRTDAGLVSPKKVLSIGGSVDWQKDVNVVLSDLPADQQMADATAVAKAAGNYGPLLTRGIACTDDYVALAADLFWDIPIGETGLMSLNGQVNFVRFDYGDRENPMAWYNLSSDAVTFSGYGLLSELGFRYNRCQPVILVDWYESEGGYSTNAITGASGHDEDLGDVLGLYGGFNYWLFGHTTSLKIQFGSARTNGSDDWTMSGRFQAQLLF